MLVVIDPAARSTDGESVRIAKDVLCAGAGAKICLPEGPEEFARALARRGQRRPVVIGDDRALLRAVGLLHKERELGRVALSVVPVGAPGALALSGALGVPTDTVAAARTVLDGGERPMDLLTDDSDGIVLGGLRIPCGGGERDGAPAPYGQPNGHLLGAGPGACLAGSAHSLGSAENGGAARSGGSGSGLAGAGGDEVLAGRRPWWAPAARTARSALALLSSPAGGRRGRVPAQRLRLRVEADGVLLADLDRPVRGVSVMPGGANRAVGVARADGSDGSDGSVGSDGSGGADGVRAADAAAGGSGADGLAEVVVHWPGSERPVRTRARAVTVSGPDFHYRADTVVGGPVRTRTWTVQPGAWRLTLPRK
ncbi:diacylglycerol kinase catalytic domain-containing protein [Streptomyces halobius]|uniref:Diacylglycerol kinase-like protein n=1 Tax=Streptomyces halobius TaxID=2879846 RepID=A0ABY4M9P8_9ACTN|nr:hypothetical protein [Streptomyces halobius]UQA94506.1 hypothetical protein K9S39_23950 [Streptomyces halobius]